jgi:ribosomal protein S18 acetylase RimI-like enzyme
VRTSDGLIEAIEVYYDAVPRAGSTVEQVGPFTLFVGRGPWGYYARPTLGTTTSFTPGHVAQVRARQRELDVAEEIEWQDALAPSLAAACADAGMTVHRYRLLVLQQNMHVAAPGEVRIVSPVDDLAALLSTQQQGFGGAGSVDPGAVAHLRDRLASRATVAAAGFVGDEPVCVGVHQPVDEVSEVVGVATLPEHRRTGWAGAVTSALVTDAHERGVSTVFLSAADDAVARVYERVGFRDVGVACAAEPAKAPA